MSTGRHSIQIAAWLALPLISLAQPKYTIHDLGSLGGPTSAARGINNSGQVVGVSQTASGQRHAFRTAPNSAINPATDDLGTLFPGSPDAFTAASGINSSGQVAGESAMATEQAHRHAFRTAANSAINPATDDLGTLGGRGISAFGINNSGQVAGVSDTGDSIAPRHAFRTAPNRAINPATDDLGTLGGMNSFALGINNSGQVVGVSHTAADQFHAFRTASNKAINPATDDISTLGGPTSTAYGINDSGQVVGVGDTPRLCSKNSAKRNGVMLDLSQFR